MCVSAGSSQAPLSLEAARIRRLASLAVLSSAGPATPAGVDTIPIDISIAASTAHAGTFAVRTILPPPAVWGCEPSADCDIQPHLCPSPLLGPLIPPRPPFTLLARHVSTRRARSAPWRVHLPRLDDWKGMSRIGMSTAVIDRAVSHSFHQSSETAVSELSPPKPNAFFRLTPWQVVMNIASEETVSAITVKMEGITRTRLEPPRLEEGPETKRDKRRAEIELHRVIRALIRPSLRRDMASGHMADQGAGALPSANHLAARKYARRLRERLHP